MDNVTKLKPLDKIVIIRNCSGLSITQKSILYSIVSRLGKKNFCYPSFTTLMKDTGINHRTTLSENLEILKSIKILWIIPPNKEFKSNRYGIDFDLLVRVAYQCSALGALDQCVTRTRAVRKAHSKRNIKDKLNEIKEDLFLNQQEKTEKHLEDIRKKLGFKKKAATHSKCEQNSKPAKCIE